MLDRIGVRDIDELLGAIPKDARHPKLGIGAGLSELEVQAHLERIAKLNTTAGSGPFFIGGAVPRPHIPPAGPAPAPPRAVPPAGPPRPAPGEPGNAPPP